MSVDGMKDLERKLTSLSKVDLRKETAKAIQRVRDAAVLGCPVDTGGLRQSIYADVYENGDSVIGECYTNKEYGIYVEFGTGPVGQENHAGISPDANPVYKQSGWMIPGNAMSEERAEEYGLGIARGEDGKVIGYYTNGQPAQPFMYPALKNNQDTVLKDLKTDFLVNLKGIVK